MKPQTLGRTIGIGLRLAGRALGSTAQTGRETVSQFNQAVRDSNSEAIAARAELTGRAARGAGRGIGGFLRPFSRIGGILWLEVTGVFFLLFAAFFAQTVWRLRASLVAGPDHTKFIFSSALCLVFLYLFISSFWRSRRK